MPREIDEPKFARAELGNDPQSISRRLDDLVLHLELTTHNDTNTYEPSPEPRKLRVDVYQHARIYYPTRS